MAPPAWGMPMSFPPPQPVRKSSTKKIVLITLGITAGSLLLCAILLVVTLGFIGQAALKQSIHNTPTPFAGTTPGQTILFQDPLTSNTNGWANDPLHCFFRDNGYHIQNGYICYAPAGITDDVNISVDVAQINGSTSSAYGIILRTASQGNYYQFEINSNSEWDFGKVANDKTFTALIHAKTSSALKGGLNTTNHLMVSAKGTHFVLYINGTNVGEADDSTYTSGKSGLFCDKNSEAVFTNFQMTKPTA